MSMRTFAIAFPDNGAMTRELGVLDLPGGHRLRIGSAVLPAGTRVPETGASIHAGHELSVILSGRLSAESGGVPARIEAGMVSVIPAGEAHIATVEEEMRLVYFMLEPSPAE